MVIYRGRDVITSKYTYPDQDPKIRVRKRRPSCPECSTRDHDRSFTRIPFSANCPACFDSEYVGNPWIHKLKQRKVLLLRAGNFCVTEFLL